MKYLIVDGMLSGTGIRDGAEGGYIPLSELCLDASLVNQIENWKIKYEKEHFNGYSKSSTIDALDNEGIDIARLIQNKLQDCMVEYYSDAKLEKLSIQ